MSETSREGGMGYTLVGVGEHIPVIYVKLGELDYTKFAFQAYLPEVAYMLTSTGVLLA